LPGSKGEKILTWGSARKHDLRQNTSDVHVAKRPCKDWKCARRSKAGNQNRSNDGQDIVQDAIGNPCQDILEGGSRLGQ